MVDQIIIQISENASGEDSVKVLGQVLPTVENPGNTITTILNFNDLTPAQKAAITTLKNAFAVD